MAQTADHLVRYLLDDLGVVGSPPIDVDEIARALGVTRISRRNQFEDGRLERTDGSTVIYVKAGVSWERSRFTVAHELGHLMLADHGSDLDACRAGEGTNEERLCDEFAAALLMPRTWVRTLFADRDEKLRTMRDLAAMSKTSMSAAAVRLNEVAGWNSALLQWRRDDQVWRFRVGGAIPFAMQGHVRSVPSTSVVLDRLVHFRNDVRVKLPVSLRKEVREIPAEISVRGRCALALVPVSAFRKRASDSRFR